MQTWQIDGEKDYVFTINLEGDFKGHASLPPYISLNIDTIKSLWFQGLLFFY